MEKRSSNLSDKPQSIIWFRKNPDAKIHFDIARKFLISQYENENHGYINLAAHPEYRFNKRDEGGVKILGAIKKTRVRVAIEKEKVTNNFKKYCKILKANKNQKNYVELDIISYESMSKLIQFFSEHEIQNFRKTPQNFSIDKNSTFAANIVIAMLGAEAENRDESKVVQQLHNIISSNRDITEKYQLIMARVGQGRFREDVIKRANGKCDVTGVDKTEVLIASHIKAWADCDPNSEERLDPYNGLLLTPNLDKLFDRGFISFSNEGAMLTKNEEWIWDFLGDEIKWPFPNLRMKLNKEQKDFLEQHRQKFNFL